MASLIDGILAEIRAGKSDYLEEDIDAGGVNGVFYFDIRYTLPTGTPDVACSGHSDTFKDFLRKQGADKYIFQYERPNSTPGVNLHIQCYAHLKVKQRAQSLLSKLKELYPGQPDPCYHCRPASTAGRVALSDYTSKPESRVAGPYADHYLYRGQDLPPYGALYLWQQALVTQARLPPTTDNRTIRWLVDEKGNSGKSTICKWLAYHADTPTIQFAAAWNMMEVISANRHKRMYVFDLTRTKPADVKMDDLYSILEQLKNGTMQKTKGKVESWLQMPASVWVMSNYKPDTTKLSKDRWDILTIADLC